ncbi:HlyD family efflux transporter periplasmic adaptor subunit [Uliginosibacterium sp. H3]|uniref:HlyD family efflux transporter periplasmic adaptor subunit n=1 Tax=Uliginosibacterium silvisoli TaxID=3114758 RepID=A0ABU6JXW4_9RHOO|nr:HlyD family efflux transporter periplasmic adaptor subunit [Uliginosibacterium sp. H3]
MRDRALAADSLNALAFGMANDLYPLLKYHHALVFSVHDKRLELLSVSGLARPTEDSPYLVWLRRLGPWLAEQLPDATPRWLARADLSLPPEVADGWGEWWPTGVWAVPVHTRDGKRLGLLLLLLDAEPPAALGPVLSGVFETWAYCWAALTHTTRRWRPRRKQVLICLAVLAALLLFPVRQTVLAPTELVSHETQIVSAPIDGVIAQIAVKPNQPVVVGTPLFSFDETTLRSRIDVLNQQVAVADAELQTASQRAFDNAQSKSELAMLGGTARQRRAELAAAQAQLERSRVLAPRAGVAVFADPDEWLGRPVVTGERIMQISDPAQPAMQIQLPVTDAINLEAGAEVVLYLSTFPLSPLHGKILQTSYQARAGDDGVMSYRLLATVEGKPAHARLGLHGTAKLYGERVSLGYYLLRRPIAAVRAWTGW